MQARYYQDELLALRELGREFAQAHGDAASALASPGSDPDVERLLEGTAFLCGRIRQRLDDGLPEISHALLEVFHPQHLRPLPALAMLRFRHAAAHPGPLAIPAGAVVDSDPVEGVACRFRTTAETVLPACELSGVTHLPGVPPCLRLDWSWRKGADPLRLPARLRLHLAGDPPVARAWWRALVRCSRAVGLAGERRVPLRLQPAGFAPEEALWPWPEGAPRAGRELCEHTAFPARFLSVELEGLEALAGAAGAGFSIEIEPERSGRQLPAIGPEHLLTGCVPAINLFPHPGDPIHLDPRRFEYRVRPSALDPQASEVFSIESAQGRVRGASATIPYRRLMDASLEREGCGMYQELRRPAVAGPGSELWLAVARRGGQGEAEEILSLDLLCTNRALPGRLQGAALRHPGRGVPAGVAVSGLGAPLPSVHPGLAPDLHWRLLGQLVLTHRGALDVEGLRRLLALHDLRSAGDAGARQALLRTQESVLAVAAHPVTRLLGGVPIRGLSVVVELDDQRLGGGADEAFLLGTVLSRHLASLVSVNSFTRFELKCSRSGEGFRWADRLGSRALA